MLRVGRRFYILSFVLFFFAASANFYSPAHAKDGRFEETPIPACIVESFRKYEAAKVSTRDAADFTVPKKIRPISLKSESGGKDFNSAVGIFRDHWGDGVVQAIEQIAERGKVGEISDAERSDLNAKLKEPRSALKNLRFLYEALDKKHHVPKALDELTTALGKLRDVVQGKRGKPDDLAKYSQRVLNALDPAQLGKVETEISRFQPDDRSGFDVWLQKQVRQTEDILSKRSRRAEDFHQVRKNLQGILAVYRAQLDFQPEKSDEWTPLIQFLTQVTERVGKKHEKWEREDVAGKNDYDDDEVKLPKKVVQQILVFLKKMETK